MIISFYSYKGGVGRSQMCANVAAYLALKKGKKVLLWDWDFEAPGLHYYFGKTNADIQNIGTIEVLDAYSNMMRTTAEVSEDNYSFFPSEAFVPLVELTPTRFGEGKLDLLPGGNYNDNYVNKINRFNWFEFYELLDGSVYIESLKKWAKSSEYDYVLIDSRTGINDYSGICNLQLPDVNVITMVANEQNIQGCKRIINQIKDHEYIKQGYRKPYFLPVLSRVNVNNSNYQKWSDRFTDEFSELLPKLDQKINPLFTKEIFRDFYLDKTLLPYDSSFSLGENLLFDKTRQTYPRGALISKYVNISEYLENLNGENSIGVDNQIDIETWENLWKGNKRFMIEDFDNICELFLEHVFYYQKNKKSMEFIIRTAEHLSITSIERLFRIAKAKEHDLVNSITFNQTINTILFKKIIKKYNI